MFVAVSILVNIALAYYIVHSTKEYKKQIEKLKKENKKENNKEKVVELVDEVINLLKKDGNETLFADVNKPLNIRSAIERAIERINAKVN